GGGVEERQGEQQLRERDVERDDDAGERDPALLRRRRRGEFRRHVLAAIAKYEEPAGREDEEGRGAGDHVALFAAARPEVRGSVTIAAAKTANSVASSSSCTHSMASEKPIPVGTRRGCASTRSWSAASARRSSASGRSSTR